MKILRVHAPGTDVALAKAIGAAVASFNADLDIRLRFLSIGVDEVVLDVASAENAAAAVGSALAGGAADVVVLLGGGEAGLAAAAAVVRAQVPLFRIGAGRRSGCDDGVDGASRGIDHLATCRIALGEADAAVLAAEGLDVAQTVTIGKRDETGAAIVRAVTRRRQSC